MSDLYEKAVEAIQRLHGDMSVSLRGTVINLKGVRDEIDILIDATEADIEREEDQ